MGPGLECLAKVAVLGQALGNHYTNLDGWVSIKREHLSDNVVKVDWEYGRDWSQCD